MNGSEKTDPVFELIRSLSKAEKRNFKLYANRISGNRNAKFITLFDYLEAAPEYDEEELLAKCPVKKDQLPNMKAHLHRQILVSVRMLAVQHSETAQLREQLDFANILFEKGLFRQAEKQLDKILKTADEYGNYPVMLDAEELYARIPSMERFSSMISANEASILRIGNICSELRNINELSDLAVRLYALYLQLGYARSQKDSDMIRNYFRPRLEQFSEEDLSFRERFHYYTARAWYHYILHDFVKSYRYSDKWVGLFRSEPRMKKIMYDGYLKGWGRILEGLYLMGKNRQFEEKLRWFEGEAREVGQLNKYAELTASRILHISTLNKYFARGEFRLGIELIREMEQFINDNRSFFGIHQKMVFYYKFACMYFGAGEYAKSMSYLSRIISARDSRIGRDLQCYARMLNLIASYEMGLDYNMDYQIRSVYTFLVKMNDMHCVQREMLGFLKKLNTIYADDVKKELGVLYGKLKPYEDHPFERRTFYYLDVLSWLESKISGRTVEQITRDKYRGKIS